MNQRWIIIRIVMNIM